MEQNLNQLLARINAAKEATIARDIHTDLMQLRHDYFGQEICKSLDIEYRNDVPLEKILDEILDDNDIENIPYITPDNYLLIDNTLFIIDYKVSVSMESTTQTLKKYAEKLELIEDYIPYKIEVVVLKIDPYTKQLYISSNTFANLFPNIHLDVNFEPFIDLRNLLLEKFSDDEDFATMIAHGDFTMTSSWTDESCKELYNHPIYKEFKYSMPIPYRRLFEEAINHNSYKSERWNSFLIKLREYTKAPYSDFIEEMSKQIYSTDGNYPKPDKSAILKGWDDMRDRIQGMRTMSDNVSDAKPSAHFIWAEHDTNRSNHNITKLLYLSKSLQQIKGTDPIERSYAAIGKMMDFSSHIEEYTELIEKLKNEARLSKRKISDTKLKPTPLGSAQVLWEQQFLFNNDLISKDDKRHFYKKYLGIGGHKQFTNKTMSDLDINQPKILDFDNKDIILAARSLINRTKRHLSSLSNLNYSEHPIMDYMAEIKKCSDDSSNIINQILATNFWACLNDISVIMKNLLSVAQYNKINTFRVVTCANNSVFGFLFPSSDIKSQRSTLLYSIVIIHKMPLIFEGSSLYRTIAFRDGFISISKAIRLDKARCQRLVLSPAMFLQTSLLFKGDNQFLNLMDICTFAFFTSISITKAMLSLTEPARYMMMNALAVSSHVREYIADKFSPYTKTLFSVYVCNLIKVGCLNANAQRENIKLRDVYLNDYEIIQKGVKNEKLLDSIWFPGKVDLKEFITQIYLPFYFNAKGLHEKHHVLVNLAKTIVEIELEQRQIKDIWSSEPKKQTVNLPVFVHALTKNLILDTAKHNHLRHRVESRNNFKRSITTIKTFTSSKSCIEIGDFKDFKTKISTKQQKLLKKEVERTRIACPDLVDEIDHNLKIAHANYNLLRSSVPNYVDFISIKVFDALYKTDKSVLEQFPDTISYAMHTMRTKKDFYFTFFNKEQKTYVDREIFVGEFEAKLCMYVLERIAKERCKLNPEEMISEPGDNKLKILEQRSEIETRYLINQTLAHNKAILAKIDKTPLDETALKRGFRLEINADMSKWSAQDVMYKFFWLFACDPILYPNEKEHILYFLCNYMSKKVLLPDNLMCNLLDQKVIYENDMLKEITNGFRTNSIDVKRNWLQGNFNYVSSYMHTVMMASYKDVLKKTHENAELVVNSLVHSDDNQTSIVLIQDKFPEEVAIHHLLNTFEKICLTFGCQANMKKTYATNFIKEFVSLFNICGEPYSIYGRFILTSVSDCAYLGPYEDLASRISAAQTAIKHGCPASIAWLAIACAQWVTSLTYNMLPNQRNDPAKVLNCSKWEIPMELGGNINAPLYLTALVGLESDRLHFLLNILRKLVKINYIREDVSVQVKNLDELKIIKLSEIELFKLKLIRYLSFDTNLSLNDTMGETCDMKSRSILTPRKFTTSGILKKLASYRDYQHTTDNPLSLESIYDYMLANPELLVTKGETFDQFKKCILYRYQSKKFRESLSIQNPVQLFIEQILFSHKPTIDYASIFEGTDITPDSLIDEKHNIHGNLTISQTLQALKSDLSRLELTLTDIKLCLTFTILNDPLMTMAANSYIMGITGDKSERTGLSCCTMPEFRNMRVVHHSPALILRAYAHSNPDQVGADIIEMQRDLLHVENFIKETHIQERMLANMASKEFEGLDKKRFELKELTRFYQTIYNYVKSTEHKVKIFILPHKAYTNIDFCSLLQGNLISDKTYTTIHYIKQIASYTKKAHIKTSPNIEINIAKEAFRVLSFFLDTFLSIDSRIPALRKMIENFTYKTLPLKYLLQLIENSQVRFEFLPLLYRLEKLEQSDLDRYDSLKSDDNITWNQWQVNRTFDKGEIDLILKGKDKYIHIIGIDDILKIAELHIPTKKNEDIRAVGRKLLNQNHGLRFEKMKSIITEPDNYYICYQKRMRNQYHYCIQSTDYIDFKNNEIRSKLSREQNLMVPVCIVFIAIDIQRSRVLLRSIDYLNNENFEVSRMKITNDEFCTIKRAQMSKMQFFDGPELASTIISINGLMRSPELMNLNYTTITKNSIISLAKIFQCSGNEKLDFQYLADEPMEDLESITLDLEPALTIVHSKRANRLQTFRNAITKIVSDGIMEIEDSLDISQDGFFSATNIGLLEAIIAIIDSIETNEWSTILKNSIHIVFKHYDRDAEFHLFEMPIQFLINGEPNYTLIKEFILSLPVLQNDTWSTIFEHFKQKASAILDALIMEKKDEGLNKFKTLLKKESKGSFSGMFNFFS
ncbi:RNA-dependent RNA polymerase [Murrumbidgee virus]|uniref:RNA-directed RNA polymerase L n=1 Tax=Murrumbidgee virus TaxID=1406134 RepID=U3RF03_9VIRU|nr:RNA-dependent RNA polymerase [Murrumbidgee virus]AGX00981.1 RNA-dependent RNA polymerase [Murrumbidgee virus]